MYMSLSASTYLSLPFYLSIYLSIYLNVFISTYSKILLEPLENYITVKGPLNYSQNQNRNIGKLIPSWVAKFKKNQKEKKFGIK